MENPEDPRSPKSDSARAGSGDPEPIARKNTGAGSSGLNLSAEWQRLQAWMASLMIPAPVTLGALVLAAFLIFPAFKGLMSGSTIRQLAQQQAELQQTLDSVKSRNVELERELSERDIRLSQRQQASREVADSGLYVSPLLFLESKKAATPDLISIDFSQAGQAILVFSLPRFELQDIEISIYQDARLVWSQSIVVPKEKLFNQNLVTLLLTRSALGPGAYRMTVEGNPTARRIGLNQFDLTIQG